MQIYGIGTDVVNIKRIEKAFKKYGNRFKKKIFCKNEILYCDSKKNSFSYYAKRYAAKEAFSKALGTGIKKDIKFKNIEIINDRNGKPSIILNGKAKTCLKKKIKSEKYNIYLSISDDKPWAQATVLISFK